jgi:beta-glucanase (GH16 family)
MAMLSILAGAAAAVFTAASSPPSFCAGEGWAQVWADEFSGATLNESAWNIDVKAGDSQVRNSQGTRDNVYLEGGHLVLRSQRQRIGKWNYTSGAVETQHKVSWKGPTRACVSAKLPGGEGGGPAAKHGADWCATTPLGGCRTGCPAHGSGPANPCGPDKKVPTHGSCNECPCNTMNTSCGGDTKRPDSQGVWPAHWMMPDADSTGGPATCWPSNGEIDIMEMVNGDGSTHATYHWREREIGGCGDKCTNGSKCPHPSHGESHPDKTDTSVFHEYAVEYGPDHIHYAFDGVVFETITKDTTSSSGQHAEFFDVPYYMILNTAVGGPWPGEPTALTVFPLHHTIDYVRISQPSSGKN